MPDVVRVQRLRKSYDGHEVLRGVDFALREGESHFLVGPNGSGKTTTIEIMIGLRRASEGHIELLGMAPRDPRTRPRIRVCLQGASLHAQVTVREHFEFVAALYGSTRAQIEDVAQQFDLAGVLDRRYGKLSGGQQKRVMVAGTLFGEADLLVLDEPTSGVDLESRLALWASLRESMSGRKTTLLATTHDLNEAEDYADDVLIMREGTVKAQGTIGQLIDDSGLIAVLAVPTQAADAALREHDPGRHVLSQDRGTATIGYTTSAALVTDKQRLATRKVPARERSVRLADAYLFAYRGEER